MGDQSCTGRKDGNQLQANNSQARKAAVGGWFSGFALFSFGFFGFLPAMNTIPVPHTAAGEVVGMEVVEDSAAKIEETCRWQQDVNFFASLRGKRAPQLSMPCEEVATISVPVLEVGEIPIGEEESLERDILEMTSGHPIEGMSPFIAKYDRDIAALIVGIAKKESNWGKRVPRAADGSDCFNYWGYKGAGSRGVAMGHSCFGTQEEAVKTIGDRLVKLVSLRKTSEPKNMIVWKCGSSCNGHSPESVKKWISDVTIYYDRLAQN